MASLKYLWQHRARFPFASYKFFKAWAKRLFLVRDLFKRNRNRLKLVRRGALIDPTAEIGLVKVDGNKALLQIGQFSTLGRVEIALHEHVEIGSCVCINDGCKLLTGSHDVDDPLWLHIRKPIKIDDYAWIATNSIILPGVVIGKGAIVGAGAVVSKSVPDYAIVVGNPAQQIRKERIKELKYNPSEFLAVNQAWLKG